MHTHLSYRLKRRPVEHWLYEEGREQGRGAGNDGLGGVALGALALAVPVDQEGPEEGALVQRVHPARSAFRSTGNL